MTEYDTIIEDIINSIPGMSENSYQDFLVKLSQIEKLSKSLNDFSTIFLTSYNITDSRSRDYAEDVFYDVQQALFLFVIKADYYELNYFISYIFTYLDVMMLGEGMLGYSYQIILTEWKTFIMGVINAVNTANGTYSPNLTFDELSTLIHKPLAEKAYDKGKQIRDYLTTVIGGDIGNLTSLVTDIEKIKQRQDDDYDWLREDINAHYNNSIAYINKQINKHAKSLLPRIEALEENQTTIEGNIQETVISNTEKIDKIDELLVSPISSFYSYKESNPELYQSELQIFANIFQDVLDLGYISISDIINSNLAKIIKIGE